MGRRKEYAIRSEPVLVSIGLTEGDTVSHESGIDDTSDRFSSRGPSSNNLLELDIKSESLDGKDKFTHRHSYQWNKKPYLQLVKLLLFILYNVYLIVGVNRTWSKVESWGDGIKLLVLLTGIVYAIKLYQLCLRDLLVEPLIFTPCSSCYSLLVSHKSFRKFSSSVIWSFVIVAFIVYSWYITASNRYRLVSASGIFGFVFFGYILSEHRSHIKWSQVLWGLSLQFSLAVLVLRTTFGSQLFKVIGDKITAFLKFTDRGSSFVFDYLVTGELKIQLKQMNFTDNLTNSTDKAQSSYNSSKIEIELLPQPAVFAFHVLPVVLFFSFFVSILYYYGVMQIVVKKVGWFLEKMIGTTGPESLNAAANIFLGMTEAPLVIKPYVGIMTMSELFAVMTGGFATIAGAVMAAYISFNVDASHLVSASVMAAPAALGFSKLFYPETEVSRSKSTDPSACTTRERNALEAAGNGASQAIKICSNIAANLIAFLAFIQFLNTCCMWLGSCIDCDFISFEWILSKLFIPVAFMMGVEWEDCGEVARLIGLKTIANEFIAYSNLSQLIKAKTISPRSITIATFALCGFSNFSSIGITLGALGSMVPERKSDLASIALKSMIAGTTVTLTSACMAGLLVDDV